MVSLISWNFGEHMHVQAYPGPNPKAADAAARMRHSKASLDTSRKPDLPNKRETTLCWYAGYESLSGSGIYFRKEEALASNPTKSRSPYCQNPHGMKHRKPKKNTAEGISSFHHTFRTLNTKPKIIGSELRVSGRKP